MILTQFELAQLVSRMREAQRAFFRNKNMRDRGRLLLESKELEVLVDAAVKEILEADRPQTEGATDAKAT